MAPRRPTLWLAQLAGFVMIVVATFARSMSWMTNDERRWVYHAAALALTSGVLLDSTRRVRVDDVLDASGDQRSLTIGFRAPGEDGYRTQSGEQLELGSRPHTTVFDLGESGEAVLLHDDPAFADPRLHRQLTGALHLLAENVGLLRRIERQQSAVEASRRRLVEAERHAAQVMLHDVETDVLPHLERIGSVLESVRVDGSDRAKGLLLQIREDLRLLSLGLGIQVMQGGLSTALGALVADCPTSVRLELDRVALERSHELELFMVASESVANAVKHSGATQIVVALRPVGTEVELVVTDDGRGGATIRQQGGLAGVRHRLDELGGHLFIETRPGGGTVVTARLPSVAT
jgi:signal transduction histidine kinase